MALFRNDRRETQRWFESLIERHWKVIMSVAAGYFPDDDYYCSETQQATVMRLWDNVERLKSMKSEADLTAWIYVVARNNALDFIKKRQIRMQRFRPLQTNDDATDESDGTSEMLTELNARIDRLPDDEKELILMYINKINIDEMAAMKGIGYDAMAKRIRKIKDKLKNMNS